MYSILYMELDFGFSAKAIDSLDQIADKNSSNGYDIWQKWAYAREQSCESNDSHIINAFKNVTIEYLREKIGSQRYNCTFTMTIDLRKRSLHDLRNDYIAQWRHLKQQMRVYMGTYNYQFYMIPELNKRGIVHAHGIIKFRAQTYDDYEYDRIRWVRKMKLKVGKCLQWTRINDIYNSYMPTESNVKIRRNQSLASWVKYCHKDDLRNRLGHCNMME